MQRSSSRNTWDQYWEQKQEVDDVYSNIDRIIHHLQQVVDLRGKKILEVGAGTGRDSFPFIGQGAEVYVLDYSPAAMQIISRLNRRFDEKIHPIRGDAFDIPVADGRFDIVFHQGLLEHFRDPLNMLRENIRVLKPGGLLLVDVPQKYHIYTLIKHILIFFNRWFAGWETEYTIHELKRLVERSGATVIFQYGDWKRPSLIYRMIRELFLKLHVKLPLYPASWKPIRRIREWFRNQFRRSRFSFYTYIDIGVIARKA